MTQEKISEEKTGEEKIRAVEALLRQTTPEAAWEAASQSILTKEDGFALHERVYALCCDAASPGDSLLPAWQPSAAEVVGANVTGAARQASCGSYPEFYQWSIANREQYWALAVERLGIVFQKPYERVLEMAGPTRPVWFAGAEMNIAESCFGADPNAPAIVSAGSDGALHTVTYAELRGRAGRIAAGLTRCGVGLGDAVALLLPMNASAVALYLGIVAAGASVVSIAESFAPAEIAARLRISGASLVFTQEFMARGGKTLALYDKIVAADGPPTILLPSASGEHCPPRREQDLGWDAFLPEDGAFAPVLRRPQETVNVLFSSGTTGDPKAIPWDHTTPIKCAADAHFHLDVHSGNVLCWPTSLGWMMGPWLLFAALINRGTIALYEDAPTGSGFGRFVQDARVTMLGVVPSLVRAWRSSESMEAWNWGSIRAFGSSGECSNPSDMLYLMFLAGYKPVVEYCGGTEIGGAYCTGTVTEPCAPSMFTTPALGIELGLFGADHQPCSPGEVFLRGPSVGLSTRLLNRDHDAVYFSGVPASGTSDPWRHHGDEMEALPGGGYRMLGRCDDTMNLGGIKISCIEIEQVLNRVEGILETAAVAVSPFGGGPSRLVVYAVLQPNTQITPDELKAKLRQAIRSGLNPLFQIEEVRLLPALPRTASGKVVRRALRDQTTLPANL